MKLKIEVHNIVLKCQVKVGSEVFWAMVYLLHQLLTYT